ncbi:MAG: hypothetical protein HKL90_09770 [Elusimicrobia bacterium]|nr:hypothetical protein [Elusimicrobiota bacterium]
MKKPRASRGVGFAQLIPQTDRPDAVALTRLKADFRKLRGQIPGKIDIRALVREGRG